jgi:hypothetical protein
MSPSSTSGRIALLAAAVLGLSTLFTPSAMADPSGAKNSEVVPLTCGGATYTLITNGNGDFTPGHDANSNAIFVPVWFGPFTGTITDEDGNVIDSFTDPAQTKGAGKNADIECTFTITATFDDPDLGTLTFTGSGSVTGFSTPRR